MSGKLPSMGASTMSFAIINPMIIKPMPITQNGKSLPHDKLTFPNRCHVDFLSGAKFFFL